MGTLNKNQKVTAFDKEFYKQALKLTEGRGLIIQLLKLMTMQISSNLNATEYVNQFFSVIIEVLIAFPEANLSFEEEKEITLIVISILEDLIASNVLTYLYNIENNTKRD